MAVIILCLGGTIATVLGEGPSAWPLAVPLVLVAYLGWLLFWYPRVGLEADVVRLVNPLQTLEISWHSIIHVEAKYAATIVTPHGRYTAWAAPAPGMFGALREARSADAANRKATEGQRFTSVRAGEVSDTPSGSVVQRIRQILERRADAGINDVEQTETLRVVRHIHVVHLAILLILIVASFALPVLVN
ncbi:hypothetical protein [Paeniglutamicibacter cryotolerans]|uniref:PH domain-containing protein n=1 Tax=Paeniglutamicibacter cryotolerans TaxID=670079 RepID=A0A839QCH3_9MICC|nr:hypothetical protein [Paeniglutamicibacter cryotolerans]MBB2993818.1 hypothetical protein [Paeniglutamicibacter cryotolerans]